MAMLQQQLRNSQCGMGGVVIGITEHLHNFFRQSVRCFDGSHSFIIKWKWAQTLQLLLGFFNKPTKASCQTRLHRNYYLIRGKEKLP